MKKIIGLCLFLLILQPFVCFAGQDNTLLICGKVKQVMSYKNAKKNINYQYVIIEEFESFDNGESSYVQHLPYGLYMFKIDPSIQNLGNCFEIDIKRKTVISSTIGD